MGYPLPAWTFHPLAASAPEKHGDGRSWLRWMDSILCVSLYATAVCLKESKVCLWLQFNMLEKRFPIYFTINRMRERLVRIGIKIPQGIKPDTSIH